MILSKIKWQPQSKVYDRNVPLKIKAYKWYKKHDLSLVSKITQLKSTENIDKGNLHDFKNEAGILSDPILLPTDH